MDVGAMQECDAMDGGAGGDANLFAALMQIRLSEPVGMKKKNYVHDEQRSGEDCAVPAGHGPMYVEERTDYLITLDVFII